MYRVGGRMIAGTVLQEQPALGTMPQGNRLFMLHHPSFVGTGYGAEHTEMTLVRVQLNPSTSPPKAAICASFQFSYALGNGILRVIRAPVVEIQDDKK